MIKPMNDKDEIVIKEYPNSTRWMEGQMVVGVGNLILTSRQLIFLHGVDLTDKQIERIHELSANGMTSRLIDQALTLHKNNFQIPLSAVTLVKIGLHSLLPIPRPCLRIFFVSGKSQKRMLTFMFTIPLLKGIYQWEIATVWHWVNTINRALRRWQLTYG